MTTLATALDRVAPLANDLGSLNVPRMLLATSQGVLL